MGSPVLRQNVIRVENRASPDHERLNANRKLNKQRSADARIPLRLLPVTVLCIRMWMGFGPRFQNYTCGVRQPDRNDDVARRAARQKRRDPKLRRESCRQVFPSRVRDACGRRDSNEHSRRATASDAVHLSR